MPVVVRAVAHIRIERDGVRGYNAALPFSRLGAPAMLRISQEALTFDDVLLIPGYSEVLPKDVSLKTSLTREIELKIGRAHV